MNQLLGTAEDMDPVERYEFWYQRIVPETRKNTEACFNHIMENGSSEVEYEWMHPTFGHQYVRGGAILDVGFRGAIRVKGWHQDITEQIQYNIAIREADKAIDALSSVFASVWTVNLEDKRISIIKDHNVLTDYFKRAEESIEKKEPVLIRDLVAKEFLPELNRYLDYDRLARELTQKEVISWEFRLVDENWERLVMIPLQKNTQGLVTKILFSVQEITEEKEKELENQFQLAEANRRARLQLETIASGIPGGFKISRNDKEFSFKYISQQFAAMLGYTVDEVKRKKGMLELVHPEDVEEQMEIARQMYRQGNTYVMKYRIHCKNGSWKYVMDRGRKVFLDNGDFEHWCLILDIDEQEKLNRLLRQERKQYREALVQDSIFFFHVDMNDGFLYDDFMLNGEVWLSELYDITFPIHIDELGKLVFKNMIPLTQRESGEGLCTAKEIIQMCEGGQNRFEFEYYAISIEEYHRMDFYMRQDEETGHSMVSVIGRNITRQKTEMEKAYQEAKRANVAKTEFLSRMSHDIRTPMNGILGMTRIAKDCIDNPDKVRDSLEKIEYAGEQLEMLINDVLDMSRLESGRTELIREGFEIKKILFNMEQSVKTIAEQKGISMVWHPSEIIHEYAYGSRLHIQRVLLNAMSNAVKYNKENGKVEVHLKEKKMDEKHSEYIFTITDTGIGMSEEFMNHMFEPFSREHPDAGTKYQGTGLGMAIMKELVDLMEGTIQVESRLGEGTTVRISIPLEIGVEKEEEKEEDLEEKASIEGMNILLAEDNPINAEIAGYMLTKFGAKVTHCKNGKEAYETFFQSRENEFDAIIMDIMMPVMDGLEATTLIRNSKRKDAKKIPIIAVTANAFTEDVRKTKEAGMNAHLAKPLHPKNVIQVLSCFRNKESTRGVKFEQG